MKTFKFLSNTALVFSFVMLASCSSDNDFDAENEAKTTARKIEFKANIDLGDSTDVTRATLESDNNVSWDENDKILVFCDNAEQAVTFGITPSSIDGKTATFTNYGEDLPLWFDAWNFYYALYPNASQTTFVPDSYSITSLMPTNQYVSNGRTYDKNALLMVSCADKDERVFNFKNVPALVKVTLTHNDDGKVRFVEIISDNKANKLSGNFEVRPLYNSENINFFATSSAEKKHTVKLHVPANEESVDYYIAVLPGKINGFTIKLEDEKSNVVLERHSSKNLELKRSKIYNFGSFDVAAKK